MALGHWLAMLLLMVFKSNPAAVSLMRGSSWTLDSGAEAAANCSSPQCASCHVTWRKQGDPKFHWANETLHFNPVKKTDHGNYTCTVEDSEGRQLNNGRLEILVIYPTESISLSVNNLSVSNTNYTSKEGADVTLSCAVDGFPPPLVKWHKDARAVMADNLTKTYGLHQPAGNSFLISYHVTSAGCEDEGAYVCQAGNGVNETAPIEKFIIFEVGCSEVTVDKTMLTIQSGWSYKSYVMSGCLALGAALYLVVVLIVIKGLHRLCKTRVSTRDYQNRNLRSLSVSVNPNAVVYDEVDESLAMTALDPQSKAQPARQY